ncbi:Flp family type IVb pilin [Trinickia symbiotica]|uniref:Flp family type IVb pilin n=1 Tax=Trinickia symbiotica TaxID=863227 RepID=A0A2T3XUP4_9BURK|nr:Flp family type IVb pilin [Trinickia symbiotica]PTB20234.1 Flp family type IVb pilin [Trinickia symbiotica]
MIEDIFQHLRSAVSVQGSHVVKQAVAFVREDEGATMVEYGLMVALIAIVCIAAVSSIGNNLNLIFSDIASSL